MLCITAPATARAAPVKIPTTILGSLMFQTMWSKVISCMSPMMWFQIVS